MKKLMNVLLICLFVCLVTTKEFQVTRTVTQNPIKVKCKNKTHSVPHFIAKREGKGLEHDVIHYIVTTLGKPTIILRHVFEDVTVTIDNNTFCNQAGQSVHFSDDKDDPQYAGIFLSSIFSYDDVADVVNLPKVVNYRMNVLDHFDWDMESSSNAQVSFIGTSKSDTFKGSKLVFNVAIREEDGFQTELPGYPKDANLTQFDVKLKNLPGNSSFSNLRYAIEVVMFSVNNKKIKTAGYELSKSIDDEHSPGVFEIWAATMRQTKPLQLSPCQTFMSWKPVAYSKETPGYENKALVFADQLFNRANKQLRNSGSLSILDESVLPWTVAFHNNTNYFGLNMTFGQNKDGGYTKSSFIQWSGLVGSGKPPLEMSLSDFVITVIALGLGGPFVAGFLLAVFIWIIKLLWRSNSAKSKYERIN